MRHLLIAAQLLLGCSRKEPFELPCAKTEGMFVMHWVQKSGTCGKVEDHLIDMDDDDGTCDVRLKHDDQCRVTGAIMCNGVSNKIDCKWDRDGNRARCNWHVKGPTCESDYVVTYRRRTWSDLQ
jgi:hypothetical protein